MIGPKTLVPAAVIAIGLLLVWPLDRLLVATTQMSPDEERLYVSDPETIHHFALGYDSLLADIYWMRAVQYFGTKVIENPNAAIEKTGEMPLLYPMIDIATTLEPHYMPPYRLGGYFLYFSSSPDEAFHILERGIEKNPNNVRLYQDLAFFEWNAGRCDEAARRYQEASKLPGAPSWLASMAPVVLAECGKRDFAVKMLKGMLESTDDPRMRADYQRRLRGYRALDEIDYLEDAIKFYQSKTGRLPASLAELTRTVRFGARSNAPEITVDESGTPVDPSGEPYVYDPATGEITTATLYLPTPIVRRDAASGS